MKITEEQIRRANEVNLPEFLQMNGFELKKSGREYIWAEHDSLHIYDNGPGERGKWYRFSTHEGGDNISFLKKYMDKSFIEAVEMLNNEHYEYEKNNFPAEKREIRRPAISKEPPKELTINEADNCRRVFAYLCQTRGLDFNLVKQLVNSGLVSQEEKTGNVLFKYFDEKGKIVGAEKVGTSTQRRFKGIATGSANGRGFEVVKGNGKNAYFFESSIDMLSFLQMRGQKFTDCRLVSMMGVKPNIVLETMERNGIPPENVYLCSDNDRAGNEFADKLIAENPGMHRVVTTDEYKDWNDMLCKKPEEKEQITEKEITEKNIKSEGNRMITYGNFIWNNATDNKDKTIVSMDEKAFKEKQNDLENSGLNYYAYELNGNVTMAVNDDDIQKLKEIFGEISTGKSDKLYSPPVKNIIGNTQYRYIPNKEYFSSDRDVILKMAEIMSRENIQFSGRIYPTGKGTLTITKSDLEKAKAIQLDVIRMRDNHTNEKAKEIGNREYPQNTDVHYIYSRLSPEKFEIVKPLLEENAPEYHAIMRNGKVAFALEKKDAQEFHRAFQSAVREINTIHQLEKNGLDNSQITVLSPTIHRLATENYQLNLSDFFDRRYDDAQFGEMISLVNDFLKQTPEERNSENNKVLSEMLEAKSSFDRNIELSEFFDKHNFSEEQKQAISSLYVGEVSFSEINAIDETFTVEDISKYGDVLKNAITEDEISDFLEKHIQIAEQRELNSAPEFVDNTEKTDIEENDVSENSDVTEESEKNYQKLIHDKAFTDLTENLDIPEETAERLITAFNENTMHGWIGDSVKENRIKNAIFNELGENATEEQTERVFSSIANNMFYYDEIEKGRENDNANKEIAENIEESREEIIENSPAEKFFTETDVKDQHTPEKPERTADDIKVGDIYLMSDGWNEKFLTVSTMVGIYPNDVGVTETTELHGNKFNITRNMDKYKLHSEGQYLGNINDKNFEMPEKIEEEISEEKSVDETPVKAEMQEDKSIETNSITKNDLSEKSDKTNETDEKNHMLIVYDFDGNFDFSGYFSSKDEAIETAKPMLKDVNCVGICVYDTENLSTEFTDGYFPLDIAFTPDVLRNNGDELNLLADKLFSEENNKLEFNFGNSEINDDWISENALVCDFAKENPDTSFALANAVIQYLDVKEYYDNLDINGGNYKTDFNIKAQIGEDTFDYDGRIDIGKSTFTDGETLVSHIKSFNEEIIKSDIYPYNLHEQKEQAQNVLDKLVPFLEKNSELTEEEQRIFDDFKAKNPIKNMPEIEEEKSSTKENTVDETGRAEEKPLKLTTYHGTKAKEDFETFRPDYRGAIWSDTEKSYAGNFAPADGTGKILTCEVELKNPAYFEMGSRENWDIDKTISEAQSTGHDSAVIDFKFRESDNGFVKFLLENYPDYSAKEAFTGNIYFSESDAKPGESISEFMERMKETDNTTHRYVAVFNPEQIKIVNREPVIVENIETEIEKNNSDEKGEENSVKIAEENKEKAVKANQKEAVAENQDKTNDDEPLIKDDSVFEEIDSIDSETNPSPKKGFSTITGEQISLFDSPAQTNEEKSSVSESKENSQPEKTDNSTEKSVISEPEKIENPEKPENFTITDDNLGEGGAKTKFRNNIEAIKTLKTVEAEKRQATKEEKETMSKYVGWGSLSQAFDVDNPKWKQEATELKELLTEKEYKQARSTVNDSFFTSPTVIDGIYSALEKFGFKGGNVLEPSMGVGNFFGKMPEKMQKNSHLYGVEIDGLTGRIAKQLYPDADIKIEGFQENCYQDNSFDVAVGNVPFGELGFTEENPTKAHPKIFYSTFCGSRMFLFSVSPLSRNL